MSARLHELLNQLAALKFEMAGKDMLLTWEHPFEAVKAVAIVAEIFEEMWKANISTKCFEGGLMISNFRDKSTRTRFSFASAASLLGLTLTDFDESKSQVSHGETVRETANMISFLTEVIGIRDDLFLGFGHKYELEVAEAVTQGLKEGVLPQRPAIVNLQCDIDHPTQSISDLLHLVSVFGSFENLKGKKIAMTWAYSPSYGKPMSVPHGIIGLMTRFGMEVTLAHPEGYELLPEVLEVSEKQAKETGGSFKVVHDMKEAFTGADIVYPKSWAGVEVMQARCDLLRAGKAGAKGMEDLEKKCVEMNNKHKDWECTEEMMKVTKDGKALYMHCLPADITDTTCKEGEVAKSVFERYRVPTYLEAQHKPYVISSMVFLNKFPNAVEKLNAMVKSGKNRVFK